MLNEIVYCVGDILVDQVYIYYVGCCAALIRRFGRLFGVNVFYFYRFLCLLRSLRLLRFHKSWFRSFLLRLISTYHSWPWPYWFTSSATTYVLAVIPLQAFLCLRTTHLLLLIPHLLLEALEHLCKSLVGALHRLEQLLISLLLLLHNDFVSFI